MKRLPLVGGIALGFVLAACSKAPTQTAKDNGPDNSFTRYAEGLANDEARAKVVADKANAVIAKEQQMTNQATHESADQPQ
jgi:hypothetical protein